MDMKIGLLSTILEFMMTKLLAVMFSLFTMGVARAVEIADAPIPEPNYAGILIFLVLMVGGGGWYMWRCMRNKGDNANKK